MKKILFCVFILIIFGFNRSKKVVNQKNQKTVFGIDVSHNQGKINWKKVGTDRTVHFVIVRSTMGSDRKDKTFLQNIGSARKKKLIVGAYHYYDPNENSTLQARNFIQSVRLKSGDIRPVLDIEKISRKQNMDRLRVGVKNWLRIVEKHYGTKPIIYTGLSFYKSHLKDRLGKDYPLWIAAYDADKRSEVLAMSHIFQFSEKMKLKGLRGHVDGNISPKNKFQKIIIPK